MCECVYTHTHICCCIVTSVLSDSLQSYGLQPTRLLCSWNSLGKSTGVGCHALLQRIFPTQGSDLGLLHHRQTLHHWATREAHTYMCMYIYTHTHISCFSASIIDKCLGSLRDHKTHRIKLNIPSCPTEAPDMWKSPTKFTKLPMKSEVDSWPVAVLYPVQHNFRAIKRVMSKNKYLFLCTPEVLWVFVM